MAAQCSETSEKGGPISVHMETIHANHDRLYAHLPKTTSSLECEYEQRWQKGNSHVLQERTAAPQSARQTFAAIMEVLA
ncbi:hypothetical protein SNOG_05082 [Parastagonospora nodorum SN15]|uniref:Uncharacterized protein n=1 Tax=Phaeosphaeria nodorum (strain SN15 / ATCC MYA-4574 / FGSC 10173) TaxID=321614 RepID=Q0UT32_PHANO|nr:hypothetical protein SNOG_05082 [Parastagonospora nodorum SN15]EAT87473.1 hypothetical protein SNOG_05082 [Parastagonospora nodorum SN15]